MRSEQLRGFSPQSGSGDNTCPTVLCLSWSNQTKGHQIKQEINPYIVGPYNSTLFRQHMNDSEPQLIVS